MKVLIACEYSGIVREAFIARGHDAWSCDLLDTEILGNHIKGDVLEILDDGWDLMIAHPPCTYLSNARRNLKVNYPEPETTQAVEFFQTLLECVIPKVCCENPVGILPKRYKRETQTIQPYEFGDPFRKKTNLWLKNLPPLMKGPMIWPVRNWHSGSKGGIASGSKLRSKFWPGIAKAMAEQWR